MMQLNDWNEAIAIRVGRSVFWSSYASWPFGRLTLTGDSIRLSYVLGRLTLQRGEITRFELSPWLLFWKAVRIRHLAREAPQYVVFWSRDLPNLVSELQRRGFQNCLDTSLMPRSQERGESQKSKTVAVERGGKTLALLLVRNFSFYLLLSSILILETPLKAAHLTGLALLLCSISLLSATSLKLGVQSASTSAAGNSLLFVVNLLCLSFVVGYAFFLAVERQSLEYWLQLGVFAIGALIVSSLWVWKCMVRPSKLWNGR